MLFVQDSTGGVYVDFPGALHISSGDLVDVRGWSDPGNFAPEIIRPTIQRLGRAPLPTAAPVSMEQLLTGKEDSQWTEIRGVVRGIHRIDTNQLLVHLAAGHSRFFAVIPGAPNPVPPNLIDAVVRVRGVSGTLFNQRRQLIGVQHYVPSLDHMRVETQGPRDLFARPITPISQLTQFTVDAEDAPRVRPQGRGDAQKGRIDLRQRREWKRGSPARRSRQCTRRRGRDGRLHQPGRLQRAHRATRSCDGSVAEPGPSRRRYRRNRR